jgi:hypothetical protein
MMNTPLGLLSWSRQHDQVIAPSVYPGQPYVLRLFLSDQELLAALDVAAPKIKGPDETTLCVWAKQLRLPMKVRAKVCEWVHRILNRSEGKRSAPALDEEGSAKLRHKVWVTECDQQEATHREVEVVENQGVEREHTQSAQKAAKHDDVEVPAYLWNNRARTHLPLRLSDDVCIEILEEVGGTYLWVSMQPEAGEKMPNGQAN